MQLEKEIMGERLTGLYLALENILGNYGLCAKLQDESIFVVKNSKNAFLVLDDANKALSKITHERDVLIRDHIEMSDIKSDLLSQKDKMGKAYREKFAAMQKELSVAVESREIFKAKQEEIEKKYLDVSEEFKKFKHKIKLRFTSTYEKEEKFCKKCQKPFVESENYNWSCKVHASKITGEIWWCCGKTGKDAIGCIVSKHSSKEEDDPKEEDMGLPSKFCSACKDYGHNLNECLRDPNVKTNFDPDEEKKRLKEISKNKRKAIQSADLHNKISSMMSVRSSLLEETFNAFRKEEGIFQDLKDIREEIDFRENSNRVHIELEQHLGVGGKKLDMRKKSAATPILMISGENQ